MHAGTHTHTTILRFSGFCPGQPGWAGTKRNIHPLTPIMVINHPLSASSIYYNPWYPRCSIYVPDSLFPQSVSKFSWVTSCPGTPTSYSIHFFFQSLSCVQSTCPYHWNLFCCSIEIMSSDPSLSLNRLFGTLPFSLTPHIHLTILISAYWCATSFSFLMGQVWVPGNILLRTQLLYNLPLTINYWKAMVPTAWIYSIQFKFWLGLFFKCFRFFLDCCELSCWRSEVNCMKRLAFRWPTACHMTYVSLTGANSQSVIWYFMQRH